MSTRRLSKKRRGLTLLEITIASTLMTVLMTSVTVLLRASQEAWLGIRMDHENLDAASAVLRHISRHVRQATSVSAVTAAADQSGALSVVTATGATYVWDHDNATKNVNFGVTTANTLLAEGIQTLSFTGYKADGVTVATLSAQVRLVKCQISVSLPRDVGGTHSMTSWVWVRCW